MNARIRSSVKVSRVKDHHTDFRIADSGREVGKLQWAPKL